MAADIARFLDRTNQSTVFTTTFDLETVRVYPIAAWKETLDRLEADGDGLAQRKRIVFLANYFGGTSTVDVQGRLSLPDRLREKLNLDGCDMHMVFSKKHFDVYRGETYAKQLEAALGSHFEDLAVVERMNLP